MSSIKLAAFLSCPPSPMFFFFFFLFPCSISLLLPALWSFLFLSDLFHPHYQLSPPKLILWEESNLKGKCFLSLLFYLIPFYFRTNKRFFFLLFVSFNPRWEVKFWWTCLLPERPKHFVAVTYHLVRVSWAIRMD